MRPNLDAVVAVFLLFVLRLSGSKYQMRKEKNSKNHQESKIFKQYEFHSKITLVLQIYRGTTEIYQKRIYCLLSLYAIGFRTGAFHF